MLVKLTATNFKRFREVEVELGQAVVLIGPNNSGKTTALQALALWQHGVRRWIEKRGTRAAPKKRPGVTINRRDLIAMPVPTASLLWRDRHLRFQDRDANGKQRTQNIRIEISVDGIDEGRTWTCGFEFDYANEESFYCRPLIRPDGARMEVPEEAARTSIAFLPPMSGLIANEIRLDPGAVQVRVGEGRTAEVLRNLCLQVHEGNGNGWQILCARMQSLFGIELLSPKYIQERGEITMSYHDFRRARHEVSPLDISASGRGLQQTLLLLAYLQSNPHSVLLLDEPDAHLEILRQRQIYQLLTDVAREQESQIVAASHSEVLLNEAADRDILIAFVGPPHRIDDRGNQVSKSLKLIGFEHYYQAEQTGWVLYLEGSTDLAILRAFAKALKHEAADFLERPFVYYVANQASKAEEHFFGLRESKKDLIGLLILDRQLNPPLPKRDLEMFMWRRREIENYLCVPEALLGYAEEVARQSAWGPLAQVTEGKRYREVMQRCIEDLVPPVALRNRNDRWWTDSKASDDFLDRLFEAFFDRLDLENLMKKSDYHQLARHVPADLIPPEVREVLDRVVKVHSEAKPTEDE
jgi:ABC-type lipoprotein export system ATPase subunit